MNTQKTTLHISGKVGTIKQRGFGRRGGEYWLPIAKLPCTSTGMIELDLYPGHYQLTYKNLNGHLTSTEFDVK